MERSFNNRVGLKMCFRFPGIFRLTAFALETFALATQPEYEQILYIDVDIMNQMAMWLIGQQNKSNGAFVPPSPVQYDLRYMVRF